ncbi:flagellar hook-associated protein FlgL [Clostridium rectalis]|uniref:flagellar hook-associated protein FlgL n=1 Tax=Clostridium rectalis TaxID=2040295 RepID=UPI000F62FD88|nr:flagellar hook-associated protein FlgL [Clostridium rectalis]
MRVTNSMLSKNFLSDMQTNLDNLRILQMQLTSGKEIRKPSDNPFKVSRAMQLHTDINTNKQYNTNIKNTINWLDETDTSLNQLGEQFKRMRELLVSSGNAGYGSGEREKIKDEINEIIGQISQTLNSSFDGKYIFGGTRSTAKPTEVIKGPKVTEPSHGLVLGDEVPGKAEALGKYSAKENKDFVIKINEASAGEVKKVSVSRDGGKTFEDPIEVKDGKVDIGDGLTFKIEKSDGNVKDTEYKFIAIAEGNSKLVFNSREGKPLREESLAKVTDINNWKGKEITFIDRDLSSKEVLENPIKISVGDDISDIDSLVKSLNDNIEKSDLSGKVKAVKIIDGENSSVKFVSTEKNHEVVIDGNKSNTSVENDLNGLKGKAIGNNEYEMMGDSLITEVSQGVYIDYNVVVTDLINFTDAKGNEKDLRGILEGIIRDMDSEDSSVSVKDLVTEDLANIDHVIDNVLKLRSKVGAKQNRMESAEEKNKAENFDMTEILSKTEDIDFTEKTMEMAVALSVYMASLQTSARVLQPTLMDYLR